MTYRTDRATTAILSIALTVTIIVGAAAPAMASALTESRVLAGARAATFTSGLEPVTVATSIETVRAMVPAQPAKAPVAKAPRPVAKAQAPLPKPVAPAPAQKRPTARSSAAPPAKAASTPAPAPAKAASTPAPAKAAAKTPAPAPASGIDDARAILKRYISTYPILKGSTVEFGDARGNAQAICYYKSGRIVINPKHTVTLERIIAHEIWHIIDWRDNGQIDWGEKVPPANANDFKR